MQYLDTIEIPAGSGAVYEGRFRWQDMGYGQKVQVAGDESVDADGFGFLPRLIAGLVPDLTFRMVLASSGEAQTGKVVRPERVGQSRMFVGRLLDTAKPSSLGAISDLTVLANGAGSVALVFTPATGATSHQATVDGVNVGSAADGQTGIIVLSGLTAGTKTFRVVASDGSTTTNSNAVAHEVT